MPDFCPQGFKRVTNYNGLAFCKACTISNCNECVDVKAKVLSNTTGYNTDVATNTEFNLNQAALNLALTAPPDILLYSIN